MSLFLLKKQVKNNYNDKKIYKYDKLLLTAPGIYAINKYNNKTRGVFTVTQYRIEPKKGGYRVGEEIKLHKVTAAEKVGNAALKALYFSIAALFIFNLIRFIM